MKTTLLLPLLFFCKLGFSQQDTIVKFLNPTPPKGYSQAVAVDLGNSKMIIISGQVAFDKQGQLVGTGDFSQQATQVFSNIRSIIESAGGTMDNLVRIGIYLTDMSKIQLLRTVRDKFINPKNPPASTLVQVDKLFRGDVLLEIEATAIIPKK
jgi:2-iminobutanoate/2-iminopropanoate deaminase